MRSPSKAAYSARERASPRPARPGLTIPPHTDAHHPPRHPTGTAPVAPAKTALMPIPLQKPEGHKYRRSRVTRFRQQQQAQASPRTGHDSFVTRQGRPTQRIDRPGSQTLAPRRRGTLPRRPDHRTGTYHGLPSPGQRHHDPRNTAHTSLP